MTEKDQIITKYRIQETPPADYPQNTFRQRVTYKQGV